jgi:hypothetical protein
MGYIIAGLQARPAINASLGLGLPELEAIAFWLECVMRIRFLGLALREGEWVKREERRQEEKGSGVIFSRNQFGTAYG